MSGKLAQYTWGNRLDVKEQIPHKANDKSNHQVSCDSTLRGSTDPMYTDHQSEALHPLPACEDYFPAFWFCIRGSACSTHPDLVLVLCFQGPRASQIIPSLSANTGKHSGPLSRACVQANAGLFKAVMAANMSQGSILEAPVHYHGLVCLPLCIHGMAFLCYHAFIYEHHAFAR
jgi:hypothetical protein